MRSLSKDYDVSVEEILDRGGSLSQIPTGAVLHTMRESIQKRILDHVKQRTDDSDKLLRELQRMRSQNQRSTLERERERERATDKEAEERKHKLKKIKKREPDEDRPLAVGAHGVARQDGVDLHKGEWYRNSFPALHAILLLLSLQRRTHTYSNNASPPTPSVTCVQNEQQHQQ